MLENTGMIGSWVFVFTYLMIVINDRDNKEVLFPLGMLLTSICWMVGLYGGYDMVSTYSAMVMCLYGLGTLLGMKDKGSFTSERNLWILTLVGTMVATYVYTGSLSVVHPNTGIYTQIGFISSVILFTGSTVLFVTDKLLSIRYHLYVLLSIVLMTGLLINGVSLYEFMPLGVLGVLSLVGFFNSYIRIQKILNRTY